MPSVALSLTTIPCREDHELWWIHIDIDNARVRLPLSQTRNFSHVHKPDADSIHDFRSLHRVFFHGVEFYVSSRVRKSQTPSVPFSSTVFRRHHTMSYGAVTSTVAVSGFGFYHPKQGISAAKINLLMIPESRYDFRSNWHVRMIRV